MTYNFRCVSTWLLPAAMLLAVSADTSSHTPKDQQEGFTGLVSWLRDNGGRADERLRLETNSDGIRGVIATHAIKANTEIMFCPWKLVLGTQGDTAEALSGGNCEILHQYAQEVRAGKESFWFPYLAIDDSFGSRVPTFWDVSTLEELQGLPPYQEEIGATSLTQWFSETCADDTPFEELSAPDRQALYAAITRGASMRFLPLYDLFNHDNGKLNTQAKGDTRGSSIVAVVDIPAGSEIFVSYRGGTTSTSEIFRRYGFVHGFPRQWTWNDPETLHEEGFLCLSDSVVIINPKEKMMSKIGTATGLIASLISDAERHNSKIPAKDMEKFWNHLNNLAQSLPTTVTEDSAIVYSLEHRLLSMQGRESSSEEDEKEKVRLSDKISAVRYRIYFKEAIQLALSVADSLIAHGTTTRDQSAEL